MYTCIDVDTGYIEIMDSDGIITNHFKASELACRDGNEIVFYSSDTMIKIEEVRKRCRVIDPKCVIQVVSGHRTLSYNRGLKDSSDESQHIQGRALDTRPISTIIDIDMYYDIVCEVFGAISGIGKYNTFVHADNRPYNARW